MDAGEEPCEKFFGNFPYPYMNGVLHLGHAFSISKVHVGAGGHMGWGLNVNGRRNWVVVKKWATKKWQFWIKIVNHSAC